MKLYLIRHAESANNAIVTGRGDWSARVPDPELTERGHQQAQLLAEHLTDPAGETRQHPILAGESGTLSFGLTHLYCSLMTRSILTAQYIAGTCAVRAVAHPDIFEKGGIYHESADGTKTGAPGPGRAYFRERFPALELPDSVDEDGWYNRDYETEEPFLWRIAHVLKDIRRRHALSQDRVAMVVHGDFIDQFLNEVTVLPAARRIITAFGRETGVSTIPPLPGSISYPGPRWWSTPIVWITCRRRYYPGSRRWSHISSVEI